MLGNFLREFLLIFYPYFKQSRLSSLRRSSFSFSIYSTFAVQRCFNSFCNHIFCQRFFPKYSFLQILSFRRCITQSLESCSIFSSQRCFNLLIYLISPYSRRYLMSKASYSLRHSTDAPHLLFKRA